MSESTWLAERFEEHRPYLRAVAYRMLGSATEADDAVQETWLRLSRAENEDVENLRGWLTTVIAQVCLNVLRSRATRREVELPDPIVSSEAMLQPEQEAILADSVGLALLIVLDTLTPPERLAFVLHDTFDVPFEQIGALVGRSPAAARQLASRARRRVRSAGVAHTDSDRSRQRRLVDAFFAAARAGDFTGLLAVLDPDAILRADFGPKRPAASRVIRGAQAIAGQARSIPGSVLHPVLVNDLPGVFVTVRGRPFVVMAFTAVGERIVEIDVYADPERVPVIAADVLPDARELSPARATS
ncbi:MAG TPA: sigma-70 family RNA polymerase sigma factor [Chloroflexota bacterium]|nr:sigma-70 family RNA polymerase sigma factor [Chloroflexota bacterium]